MKRKFLSLVLASAMSVTMLAGCGNKADDDGAALSQVIRADRKKE